MIVSIDIGSTWTKGALFELQGGELILRNRAAAATTTANLEEGFSQVLDTLVEDAYPRQNDYQLFYSSSAKGGLAVAALGLVPEITLESATTAAASAGAKITRVFSYQLTRRDIRELEAEPPDILLFAGGTDGGNTDYVLANARRLADAGLQCPILYAGNRTVREDVAQILKASDLTLVENLLPALDAPNPEPVREAIRAIFLEKIVKGKGLDSIIAETGEQPLPTPYAVYEFVQTVQRHVPGWEEFMLLDLGGATTDVYSVHREQAAADTIIRGMPETECKRTVEGDLGMRVSAHSAALTGKAILEQTLADDRQAFTAFLDNLSRQPDFVPGNRQGETFDQLLAGVCVAHAGLRHAGRKQPVWTPDGMINVQQGRDLCGVKKVIGSGGYLSRAEDFNPTPWFKEQQFDSRGKQVLLPTNFDYYRDRQYLLPLLANVARGFPAEAARAGIRCLSCAILSTEKNPMVIC